MNALALMCYFMDAAGSEEKQEHRSRRRSFYTQTQSHASSMMESWGHLHGSESNRHSNSIQCSVDRITPEGFVKDAGWNFILKRVQ